MAFLNLDLDFFAHPKCARLVGLIGRDSEVFPLRLWAYTAKYHSVDGKLSGYSPQAIERIVQWGGQPGQCVDALAAVGFIDKIGESEWKVHDWVDYQGHIHALKLRNKKVAKNRWKNLKKVGSSVDTSGIPKSTTLVPLPLPMPLPLKEKNNTVSPTPEINPPKFTKPTPEEITLYAKSISFELNGQVFYDFYESKGWKIGKNSMKNWQAAVRTWKNTDRREKPKAFENIGVTDDGFPDYK